LDAVEGSCDNAWGEEEDDEQAEEAVDGVSGAPSKLAAFRIRSLDRMLSFAPLFARTICCSAARPHSLTRGIEL
jgi:hypothetical protein